MPEIVLECNPDEVLVKALGYTRKMIIHQPNRGEVINYLKKNPTVIGIIDDDPGSAKPTYFSKFQTETPEKFGIESYCIPKIGTRLIVIKPRLEEWILLQAIQSKIDLSRHSMPGIGKELHKVINYRLSRFGSMLKEMLGKNNEALLYLKNLIENNHTKP